MSPRDFAAAFARFVPLQTVIDAPGQYVTRGGETVTVTEASTRHDFGCLGRYPTGQRERWHKSGRLYPCLDTFNDIVRKA